MGKQLEASSWQLVSMTVDLPSRCYCPAHPRARYNSDRFAAIAESESEIEIRKRPEIAVLFELPRTRTTKCRMGGSAQAPPWCVGRFELRAAYSLKNLELVDRNSRFEK